MKETIIRITCWHVEQERVDDKDSNLIFYGSTKDGEGNRHKIYVKIPYSWTGFLLKILRSGLQKQIDRFQTYFKD